MSVLTGNIEGALFKARSEYQGLGLKYGYVWFSSTGVLRSSASKPSDLDSDGDVVGTGLTAAANQTLSNLSGTTAISVDLQPDANGTIDLGDAALYWRYGYIGRVYLNATAYLDGGSAGVVAITGNVTISGTLAFTSALTLGVDGTGVDFILYGDTASDYLWWDQNGSTNGALIFTGATSTPSLQFTNTNVTYSLALATDVATLSATDHASAKLIIGTVVTTNGLDLTWQSHTSGAKVDFNAGADSVTFDDVTVSFMATTTAVGSFTMAATHLYYDGTSANNMFNIGHTTITDFQLDGAGGYDLFWDGSGNTLIFKDNAILSFGTDADLTIVGNNTTIEIDAGAANYVVDWGATTATDLIFHGADANRDIRWDASADTLGLLDNAILGFGNTAAAPDIYVKFDATNVTWLQTAAGVGGITYGVDGKGIDITWYSETASSYFKIDQANDRFVVAAANMDFGDASGLFFGTGTTYGGDIKLSYVGATNILAAEQVVSGTGTMTFGADSKGITTTWYVETASSYIKMDQANDRLLFYIAKLDIGNATVTYDAALSTNSLVYSCTDNAGAKLIFGTSGTNGQDFMIQGAAAAENWTFDAGAGRMTYQGLFYHAAVLTATKTTGALAATDCGYLLIVTADAQTLTLPTTVAGAFFWIMNGTTGQALTIQPDSGKKISGAGFTAANDKYIINTAATAKRGDYVKLVGDGSLGWYVVEMAGVWARQA